MLLSVCTMVLIFTVILIILHLSACSSQGNVKFQLHEQGDRTEPVSPSEAPLITRGKLYCASLCARHKTCTKFNFDHFCAINQAGKSFYQKCEVISGKVITSDQLESCEDCWYVLHAIVPRDGKELDREFSYDPNTFKSDKNVLRTCLIYNKGHGLVIPNKDHSQVECAKLKVLPAAPSHPIAYPLMDGLDNGSAILMTCCNDKKQKNNLSFSFDRWSIVMVTGWIVSGGQGWCQDDYTLKVVEGQATDPTAVRILPIRLEY